ncbi:DUF3540 domain-containing protein [Alcaligenaceae bacterium SJ-26]|nr:DUF3540 domain-containing protein [Alcaligenaceae bacterium SJ-26]
MNTTTMPFASDTADSMAAQSAAGVQGSSPGRASLHHVKVQALQGDCCVVICADGFYNLPVAAGCLLQPQPGDTVLASLADGQGYVIQVLQRHAAGTPACLRVEGNTELDVRGGSLRLAAESIDMQAAQAWRVRAQTGMVETGLLSIEAARLAESGGQRQAHWDSSTEVLARQQSFIGRRELYLERGVRRVATHEEQSAGSVRLVVARDWRVRADSADLLGGRRVKVDADTVQLG